MPSKRSKTKDHNRYLVKRLQLWKEGKLNELLAEGREIQKRMAQGKERKKESKLKGFRRLMLEGKVRQAMKLVDAESDVAGLDDVTERVREILKSKHPPAEDIQLDALCNKELSTNVQEVVFENIDLHSVQLAAKNLKGSGGPTKIDAEIWTHILCSKSYGKLKDELSEEVALATRRLCIESIPFGYTNLLFDCRLVPLKKEDDGVRPIGIGEALRRIMGKTVAGLLKKDIELAGGTLQTCTGVESGI